MMYTTSELQERKERGRLEALADGLKINAVVDYLGGVPPVKVPELYRKAAVFAYPSAMESFGLPPLKAMACGTPVVASNRASVPVVVGDAALVVDPDDESAFAAALERAFISTSCFIIPASGCSLFWA